MIIASTENPVGQHFLLLGLSRINIERLLAGQPIKITNQTHGPCVPPNLTLAIMFGETEASLREDLVKLGLIDKETQFHDKR